VKSLKIFVQTDFSKGMEAGVRRFSSVLCQISCHVFLLLEEERCTNVILLLWTVSMRGSGEVESLKSMKGMKSMTEKVRKKNMKQHMKGMKSMTEKKREYETSDERYED
jgi:hypothetical protein